mmetsp:Transcript_82597/g.181587  ORF Transcript_82597/g.181587 Transcript_82597/m.181587 type:complete len:148 (+) Transcript_82597:3017-3460(+)
MREEALEEVGALPLLELHSQQLLPLDKTRLMDHKPARVAAAAREAPWKSGRAADLVRSTGRVKADQVPVPAEASSLVQANPCRPRLRPSSPPPVLPSQQGPGQWQARSCRASLQLRGEAKAHPPLLQPPAPRCRLMSLKQENLNIEV